MVGHPSTFFLTQRSTLYLLMGITIQGTSATCL